MSKRNLVAEFRQESAGPLNFESVFVDSQSFDFCVKGWSWNPQFACRTTWTGYAAPTFCEGGLNHFLFLPTQCTAKRNSWTSDFERLSLEPRLVHRKSISVAQDDGPFNYILELTNVAR